MFHYSSGKHVTNEKDSGQPSRRLVCAILLSMYIITVAAKVIYIKFNDPGGPTIFGDELLYRIYAACIHNLAPYRSFIHDDPAYPPLYPGLLSFGFFLPDDHWFKWFRGMLAINALASSSLIFVVYFLSKRITTSWSAIGAAAISAVIPFQSHYSFSLLSENLAMPAFLLPFALALRPRSAKTLDAVFFGLSMVGAYLVKYLFLVYAPVAYGIFLTSQWFYLKPLPSLKRLLILGRYSLIVACAAAIPLSLWLLYSTWSGNSWQASLGFWVSPAGYNITSYDGLGTYALLNFFTIILSLVLFLPFILVYFNSLLKNGKIFTPTAYIYASSFVILTIFLWLFVTWFSWKVAHIFAQGSFNFDKISQPLSWRYMMYILPFSIPLSLAGIEFLAKQVTRFKIKWLILYCIIVSLLGVISYLFLFTDYLWKIPISRMVSPLVSGDIIQYEDSSLPLIVISLSFLLIIVYELIIPFDIMQKRKYFLWRLKTNLVIFVGLAIIYTITGLYTFSLHWEKPWFFPREVRKISKFIKQQKVPISEKTLVVIDKDYTSKVPGLPRWPYEISLDHTAWLLHFWLGNPVNVAPGRIKSFNPRTMTAVLEPLAYPLKRSYGRINPAEPPAQLIPTNFFAVFGYYPVTVPASVKLLKVH